MVHGTLGDAYKDIYCIDELTQWEVKRQSQLLLCRGVSADGLQDQIHPREALTVSWTLSP